MGTGGTNKVHTLHQWIYLWWSLCTLYILVCQVRVTIGDSGLCCCVCVTSVERQLTPLCVDYHVVSRTVFCFSCPRQRCLLGTLSLGLCSPQLLKELQSAQVALSLAINETLKWLLSLPTLIQNHSSGDSVALGSLPLSSPPGISVPAPEINRRLHVQTAKPTDFSLLFFA